MYIYIYVYIYICIYVLYFTFTMALRMEFYGFEIVHSKTLLDAQMGSFDIFRGYMFGTWCQVAPSTATEEEI